jgi:hypothetical protein
MFMCIIYFSQAFSGFHIPNLYTFIITATVHIKPCRVHPQAPDPVVMSLEGKYALSLHEIPELNRAVS